MLAIGAAFLLFAALIQFFGITMINAAWVVGVVFIVLGLLPLGGVTWPRR